MQEVIALISENWKIILVSVVAAVGGGLVIRWRIQRHSGSSSYADQRNASAGGDIVGRDKISKN